MKESLYSKLFKLYFRRSVLAKESNFLVPFFGFT